MLLALLAAVVMNGYVDDAVCGNCHADRVKSYQHVGMSQAFAAPRNAKRVEDLDAPPFFHAPSNQYFEMRRGKDGGMLFRRYQLAADGAPIHVFEQSVDWIIGSGNHARTYVYRVPSGELFQLPLGWYRESGWGMAPGFDRPDHEGVTRRVRHECMFCHNAYPAASPEPLSYWRSQSFPAELPEGIGCQRCHGPGAEHARTSTRASIVNPARLPAKLRNDICYECHLQPSVAMPGLRRFGRDIYSFRPGQSLAEYRVRTDIDEETMPRAERFEINHHPYRLEQSRCFRESEGRLSCLTCHDPHQKITDPAHYRKACMSCHQSAHRATENCVACHMQKRRPQDVVHTVMTDHFIRRSPGGAELTAPRKEREPLITHVDADDELYALLAFVRATGGADAGSVRKLQAILATRNPPEIEPWLDLASALLRQRQWRLLEQTAKNILTRAPKQELALEWLALARAAQSGDPTDAIRTLSELPRAEASFNAGVLLAGQGRTAEAIPYYEKALAQRPNLVAAWVRLGEARRECGDLPGAIDAFRKALEIDPTHARANAAIVDALRAIGDVEEAERYRTVATGRMPGGFG